MGYLHDAEKTAKVTDKDGWYYTGDIGYVDAEGSGNDISYHNRHHVRPPPVFVRNLFQLHRPHINLATVSFCRYCHYFQYYFITFSFSKK